MEHVYKKLELVGTSKNSVEDAIANALARAAQTIRNMRWFEVGEVRGHIENQKVSYYQVTLKIGFAVEGTD
jgi:flavin-binding protein dodecin